MTGAIALRGRVLDPGDAAPGADGPGDGHRLIEDGAVLCRDGRIEAVGEAPDVLAGAGPDVTVHDHRGRLVVPGFVDAHLHIPQTQVIASHGLQLLDWLRRYTFVEEARFADPRHCAANARFLVRELFRNGTTTACAFGSVHPESVDAFFAEAERFGARMIAGKSMMDRNAPDAILDTAQRGHDETAALIARWQGRGRLEVAITPRFAITSSEAQLEAAGALAREHPGLVVQTHLGETRAEIEAVRALYPNDATYAEVYARHGLLRPRALMGHAIHLEDREVTLMAEAGATAVHCPTSNNFLGSGLFDRARLEGAGVALGLATDIGAGTSYSMLQTAAAAYAVGQLRGAAPSPMRLLHDMTRGNALALGLGERLGRIAPGFEADLVVLDPAATPALARRVERAETIEENVFALLVLGDDRAVAATYVAGVCVNGRDAKPV